MLSKRRVASFQRRTLLTMSSKIEVMLGEWQGRDQELMNQMDKLHSAMARAIQKLDDKMAKPETKKASREELLNEEVKQLREQLKMLHIIN